MQDKLKHYFIGLIAGMNWHTYAEKKPSEIVEDVLDIIQHFYSGSDTTTAMVNMMSLLNIETNHPYLKFDKEKLREDIDRFVDLYTMYQNEEI